MKKFFILSIILFLQSNNSIFSQAYQSIFGRDSSKWSILLNGYCDAGKSEWIHAKDDTLINGRKYKKLNAKFGAIREDTTSGKAWHYDYVLKKEYLIMDLSLQLGDKFYIYNSKSDSSSFIVDSIYYIDNKKHLRITANWEICRWYHDKRIVFIEGSGASSGILYQIMNYNYQPINLLLCHIKDGVKVIGNSIFNERCEVNFTNLKNLDSNTNSWSLSPNPVSEFLTINFFDSQIDQYRIFNIQGLKVLEGQLATEPIEVKSLIPGHYIIKIGNQYAHFKKY